MGELIWITVDDVLVMHSRQLAEHGGQDGVRDLGLLESAIERPRHLYAYSDPRPSITELAASYAFGIARNHAFLDGNKRTALVVCRTFLIANRMDLFVPPNELYQTFLGLGAGSVSEAELADWLAKNTQPLAAG